ncbi:MAG: hypothetical protein ACLPX9_10955 [Rhodomicrobium sp.]
MIAGTGQRHGPSTWAVLDTLKHGDADGDGRIQLSELVAHVQNAVRGLAHGLARANRAQHIRYDRSTLTPRSNDGRNSLIASV